MNKPIKDQSKKNSSAIARFVFEKGRKVHQEIDRMISQVITQENREIMNLTIAQMEVIMTVHKEVSISVTELSKILNVSAPSVSTMVERLVEKDILTRTRDRKDRRKVFIAVTAETSRVIEIIEKAILEMFEELIQKIGSETSDMWCKVLIALESALENKNESE